MKVAFGWIQCGLRNFFIARSVALSSMGINQPFLRRMLAFWHGYSCHDLWPNRKNCRILAIINADRVHNSIKHIFGGGGSYRNKGPLIQIKAGLRPIQHNDWSAKVLESRAGKLQVKWHGVEQNSAHNFFCVSWVRINDTVVKFELIGGRQQIFKSEPERSSHKKRVSFSSSEPTTVFVSHFRKGVS